MWSEASRGAWLALAGLLALPACREAPTAEAAFPAPHRPVAPIVSSRYSNEDARDSVGEAETVLRLAGVASGMSVADIGAGEGYYTVRLAPLVGPNGKVLAQDIVPETRDALAQRVERERLANVAVKLGEPADPKLPAGSFDRVFLVHMYHEIEEPARFLWNLRPALKQDGSVVVVDADRPIMRHGMPPQLLICEMEALGFALQKYEKLADGGSYFAQFVPDRPRPEPGDIPACQGN